MATLVGVNSAGNSSGGSLVVPMGTGIASGHLSLIGLYLETDTNSWATPPSGYSLAQSGVNTGAFGLSLYWKIAGASEPSQTVVPTTSAWRTAVSACFSGFSGTAVDVAGTVSQGDSISPASSQTAASITTLTINDLLIFLYGNFSGTNVTTLTGAASTLAISNGGLTIAYANLGATGATGTTAPSAGPGSDTYAAMQVAFTPSSGGGGPANPVSPLFFQQANAVYRM